METTNIQLKEDKPEDVDETALTKIDYSDIESLDPTLQKPLFEYWRREDVPIKVLYEGQQTNEKLTVRILLHGDAEPLLFDEVYVEVSSDDDLFFFYSKKYTENDFLMLAQTQQLTIQFEQFPDLLKTLVGELGKTKGCSKKKNYAAMVLGGELAQA